MSDIRQREIDSRRAVRCDERGHRRLVRRQSQLVKQVGHGVNTGFHGCILGVWGEDRSRGGYRPPPWPERYCSMGRPGGM